MQNDEKQPTVASPIKPVVSGISKILADSFMTSNSTPEGDYAVNIKVDSLQEAHQLHRYLIHIRQSC